MNPIESWLAARDADTLQAAWEALGARPLPAVTPAAGFTTEHATARLAADLLGWDLARLAWLTTSPYGAPSADGPPVQRTQRGATHSFLENSVDVREPCSETWELREDRDGRRGVQRLNVGFGIEDGSRDGVGGGGCVVRIFDLPAGIAVSVVLSGRGGAVVAPDDATRAALTARAARALDLYGLNRSFRLDAWKHYDRAALRALVATLGSAADEAFGPSASWAGTSTATDLRETAGGPVEWRFAEEAPGARAVHLTERPRVDRRGRAALALEVRLDGLPWGCRLELNGELIEADGFYVVLVMRLPAAALGAILATLARAYGVAIS